MTCLMWFEPPSSQLSGRPARVFEAAPATVTAVIASAITRTNAPPSLRRFLIFPPRLNDDPTLMPVQPEQGRQFGVEAVRFRCPRWNLRRACWFPPGTANLRPPPT